MPRAIADTHAVIWYLYNDRRLSAAAKNEFEEAARAGETIGVSAITLVEIVYLVERRRIQQDAVSRLLSAMDDSRALLAEIPLERMIIQSLSKIASQDIPEMPDRIIAATGVALGIPIISRDHVIQASGVKTIW